jgi:TetR/AcrR family transcriptional regulator, transcriptional repressor for nem operon
MDIGRQSMYDTFGDKRALFLKALKMYVAHSVHSISVELERPGSALSAIQNALVTFAERKDLSSAEGCMGLNAITEFGRQDADVTRISRDAARVLRRALVHVLTRAKNQREISASRIPKPCDWLRKIRAHAGPDRATVARPDRGEPAPT